MPILDELYTDIASAIREKEPSEGDIKASDFPDRITGLRTKNNISSYPLLIHCVKGATITATQGDTVISKVMGGGGVETLWLPESGIWNVVAQKGSYTSPITEIELSGDVTLKEKLIDLIPNAVEPLTTARRAIAGASIGYYAIFAGGYSPEIDETFAYDSLLTKVDTPLLSDKRAYIMSASNPSYAVFAGGILYDCVANVEGYDSNLTKKAGTNLRSARRWGGSTGVGDVAIFGGGTLSGYPLTATSNVDSYNSNMTRSVGSLSSVRCVLDFVNPATSIGDYGLIGCGWISSSNTVDTLDAFTETLTRKAAPVLSAKSSQTSACSSTNYAMFQISTGLTVYNANLTKSNGPRLSCSGNSRIGVSLNGNGIFFGGNGSEDQKLMAELIDPNLTKKVLSNMTTGGTELSAATTGSYAIIAGGCVNAKPQTTVDVYGIEP
ncbi:MAG: hypothetical protein HDQ88_08525 [Clostridia bacterium]|nr:hypothetical protein [Clostridia bacterium]